MTKRKRSTRGAKEQPTPPKPPVAVKGRGDGLRITVTSTEDPDVVENSLQAQLEQRAVPFFAGASVVLELPDLPLDLELAARLSAVIEAADMSVTNIAALSSGRAPKRSSADAERARQGHPTPSVPAEAAMVVDGTVRSGQRIAHDGAVVVFGDVNPGAEVLAGGSVLVWGRLRGTVEAGLAEDALGAVVCALDLAPTQLRIGPALARAPEEPDRTPVPEVARQVDGLIVVDAWR